MDLHLKGRHVFIAGASRGIGRAMAEAFLAEGAKVTLTGRGEASLAEAKDALIARFGKDAIFATAGDMTKTDVLAKAFDAAEAALGPVHTLICNVGLDGAPGGYNLTDEQWESGLTQNFLGSIRLAREALNRMLPRPAEARAGFNIIFISSIAGCEALGSPISYGSAKAAVNHAAKEMAKLVGKENIRINVIAPGNIIFPDGDWEKRVAAEPDIWNRWIKREVALRRFGKPEEIAYAALMLASPNASFVNGHVMVVDGGQLK